MSVELETPQPIEGQSQDQPAHDAGQVPGATPESTTETPEGEPQRKPRQELSRAEKGLLREVKELREVVKQLRGAPQQHQQTHAQEPELKRPTVADYRNETEYLTAVEQYAEQLAERKAAKVAGETVQRTFSAREEQQYQQAVADKFWENAEKSGVDLEDLEERRQDLARDPLIQQVHPSLQYAILESDVGPALIQALTDDPRLLASLTGDPVRAARTLSRLEATLSQKPAAASAPTPAAPPPGPAVKPTARVQGTAPVTTELPTSGDAYYRATRGRR